MALNVESEMISVYESNDRLDESAEAKKHKDN
jgi:hypothetical protein